MQSNAPKHDIFGKCLKLFSTW